MSKTVIYHNPRCSKSRQTLQLLRDNNIEPTVVEYLNDPPSEQQIKKLLTLLQLTPLQLMRRGESAFKEADLGNDQVTDDQRIAAMVKHPILIERPIVVVDDKKAALGRPPENVLEIL